ncbi:kinesin heavy chain-like isoform X5 [Stegodyphus dumicola]|uniref:kinesin heavy chain-like isoform X5 n=1 Tax=Stegodyphus dumicola TaxID=202533 RepID=UPI0015AA9FD4|nr:kinesin heavy chain-like isoform X5 [Stegodyphus dumicola]
MARDELLEKSDMLEKIKNMKVIDLKRMLKACSLPTNGNKPDLVERLTEAYISGKGSEIFAAELVPELNKTESNLHAANEADFAAELEGKVPELNETESNEKYNSDLISSSSFDHDSDKVSGNSEEDLNLNADSEITGPLKEQAVTNENKVVKKKMRINRNTTSINFDFFNPNPVNPIKSTNLTVKAATGSLQATTKDMPNAEKQLVKAERYSPIVFSASEKPAIRSGVAKLHTSAASTSLTDLERLKRRAERFGESVSSVLREMEEKEKLERRMLKFGIGGPLAESSRMSDEMEEKEKLERRKLKFGTGGPFAETSRMSDEMEEKEKLERRKLKFGTGGPFGEASRMNDEMEEKEKLERRMLKFGTGGPFGETSRMSDEMEEKRRLERRRLIIGIGEPLAALLRMGDEEKKKKRAERFGLS